MSFSKILRKVCFVLSTNEHTYYLGMIFVRFARKIRHYRFKNNSEKDFHIVNFMGNIKMRVDKNSYMGGSIYWTGFHHLNELLFLKRFLKSDMTFVDIGANQGEFSVFAASKLKEGNVIAFEPVTQQRDLLHHNINLNQFRNITVHPFGLSDNYGSFPIYTSLNAKLHAGLHDGLSTLYTTEERSHLQETVEIKVFDDIFHPSLNRLDFIKIDIEGAELFALKGMEKSIEKFQPTILIEINEDTFNAAGYSSQELFNFLRKYNYKAHKITKGRLTPIEDSKIKAFDNYVFKV